MDKFTKMTRRNASIELKFSCGGIRDIRFLSVRHYEVYREKRLLGPLEAPPVQDLTSRWRSVGEHHVRINDREIYDQEMRELLGLDWLMAPDK